PRMERGSARAQRALAGLQDALSDSAVGAGRALGLARFGAHGEAGSAKLAGDRHDSGPRASRAHLGTDTAGEADAGRATPPQVPGVAQRMKRPRMDVNLEELDRIIERGTHAPLSESESEKLKSALHALVEMLPQPRSTEKTKAVLGPLETPAPKNDAEPVKGHGRNGASSYTAAKKIAVEHPTLHTGDACPGCGKGKVYRQKEPRVLVR